MGRLDQRKRGPQRRDAEADSEAATYFMAEIPRPASFHFLDPGKLWPQAREVVLARWIAANPGTRPPAWWKYDAPRWLDAPDEIDRRNPEPRRRLGGTGTPKHEVLGYVATFTCGIPNCWVDPWEVAYYGGRSRSFAGVAVDPDDPPTYESEAAYLHRHGLLEAAELAAVKRLGLLREVATVHIPVEAPAREALAH